MLFEYRFLSPSGACPLPFRSAPAPARTACLRSARCIFSPRGLFSPRPFALLPPFRERPAQRLRHTGPAHLRRQTVGVQSTNIIIFGEKRKYRRPQDGIRSLCDSFETNIIIFGEKRKYRRPQDGIRSLCDSFETNIRIFDRKTKAQSAIPPETQGCRSQKRSLAPGNSMKKPFHRRFFPLHRSRPY